MAMLDKMKDSINAAGQGISTKIKDGLESERISAKIRDDEKMIEKLIYQVGVQCVKRHAEEAGTEYEELFAEIRRLRAQIEKEKEKITTFYLNITNAPAVSHALSNGQLELDQENLNYRCCLLTDALTTFANSFSQTILTFKNNVSRLP